MESGRVYGLVGQSGSGKSTRQIAPTAGTIDLKGEVPARWGGRTFARQIAYMPQFYADNRRHDGSRTGGARPLSLAWNARPVYRQDQKLADETIDRTGLKRFADSSVARSPATRGQRAWIAMMLAQNAQCLLLDEPTSALDVLHQDGVLALFRELSHERRLTVVVLHDINLAARL
ncbi:MULTISPECIES: ATP-binding cassette domain-containing protein [unclassified Rhizobium]|uniref:ATP-binding cassette domain-containing protein n=1 Tax=unclassified Rhizobium TaxID=2613769 RepID=UPI001677E40F|nr:MULTISPECIES: ATP-binding cassette domain-containing protein [unclassified Rhizobium]